MNAEAYLKRARKAHTDMVGKVFGDKLTITGVTVGKNHRGNRCALLTYVCRCGTTGTGTPSDFARGRITGSQCSGCVVARDKKAIEDAKKHPQIFTDDQVKKINKLIHGIAFEIFSMELEGLVDRDDIVSRVWEKLMTYPDMSKRPTGQILAAARSLAYAHGRQMMRDALEEMKSRIPPKNSEEDPSEYEDVFDNLIIPETASVEADEIKLAALTVLSPEERRWLLEGNKKGKSTTREEYVRLVNKVKAAYEQLQRELTEGENEIS